MTKQFSLPRDQFEKLVSGYGSCIASDKITVEGLPVRFMYKEEPKDQHDSGWRFFSGWEDDEYTENPDNFARYDVNTIANYDRSIIPHLEAESGCAFEKEEGEDVFVEAEDWEPPEE
jgi:hypothetical protein